MNMISGFLTVYLHKNKFCEMKRSFKIFWIIYFIWAILNVALLVMAVYDIFGEFDKSAEKFWPFSVGSPSSYDFLELLIYLSIPLIFLYLYKLTHHGKKSDTVILEKSANENAGPENAE
jgi:hypothetical protein